MARPGAFYLSRISNLQCTPPPAATIVFKKVFRSMANPFQKLASCFLKWPHAMPWNRRDQLDTCGRVTLPILKLEQLQAILLQTLQGA
jgi:hypothetical protein